MVDGLGKGLRAIDVKSPSGLDYTILADRGMDISSFSYKSIPFSWISSAGNITNTYYDDKDTGWFKNFIGGFLTTCGLSNIGLPCKDEGKEYGLHGRISNLSAEKIFYDGRWNGEDFVFIIQGTVREVVVLDYNFEFKRKITTLLSEPKLIVEDTISNIGHSPAPYMILYHINIGWPVLDENLKVFIPGSITTPMNNEAKRKKNSHLSFTGPLKDLSYELYLHEFTPDKDGFVTIILLNPLFDSENGLGLSIRYLHANLPYLIQFKKLSKGEYFCSFEPASSFENRATQRERKNLRMLEPFETITNLIEFAVLPSNDSINDHIIP